MVVGILESMMVKSGQPKVKDKKEDKDKDSKENVTPPPSEGNKGVPPKQGLCTAPLPFLSS